MTRLDPSGTWRENAIERVAVGRFGHVEEHSNLACYLLSDFSSWITGSVSNALSVVYILRIIVGIYRLYYR